MNQLKRRISEFIVTPIDVVLIRIPIVDRCKGVKERKETKLIERIRSLKKGYHQQVCVKDRWRNEN